MNALFKAIGENMIAVSLFSAVLFAFIGLGLAIAGLILLVKANNDEEYEYYIVFENREEMEKCQKILEANNILVSGK